MVGTHGTMFRPLGIMAALLGGAELVMLFDSITAGQYEIAELRIPGVGTDAPYEVKMRLVT